MNKPKVGRNSSSAARKQPAKGDAYPRNPLKDLNVSASSTSLSTEAPSAPAPSRPHTKNNTQNFNFDNPRKPRSENLRKPAIRAPVQRKNEEKLSSRGNLRRQTSSGNKAGGFPRSRVHIAETSDQPAIKLPSRFRVVNPSLSDWKNGHGSASQGMLNRATMEETDAGKAHSFSFLPVMERNETPADKVPSTSDFGETSSGTGLIDTPLNKVYSSGSRCVSTPETTTPPLQASVSPEIPDGIVGALPSTPACFAAGHVLVGVSDKRKCRPRGILTVQNEVHNSGSCADRIIQNVLGFSKVANLDRASLSPSPAQASINWISSPNEIQEDLNFRHKSPELRGFGSTTLLVQDCFTPPSSDGVSKITVGKKSLEFEGLERPTKLVSEATPPSSGNNPCRAAVYKNSAENASQGLYFEEPMDTKSPVLEATTIEGIVENGSLPFKGFESPYTLVPKPNKTSPCSIEHVRRQSLHCPHETSVGWVLSHPEDEQISGNALPEDKGLMESTTSALPAAYICCSSEDKTRSKVRGYRYNLVEDSPYSGDSWASRNLICTPASSSNSKKHVSFSLDYLDHDIGMSSIVEALKTVNSSTQNLDVMRDTHKSLLVPDESMQLSYPATPSNSIDGTHFQRINFDKASDVRISWREGLVSRIFEMDELDCCHWQSEEEDYDLFKPDFRLSISPDLRSSVLSEENDPQLTSGCGSSEYVDNRESNGKSKLGAPLDPCGCAESISTDGGGLVASGDSDWTMSYKNQLFET
ncbi:hypothetical protein H6P81_012999 [Aristolochia fimbriata]|uniref:Uncharacterized protein n=1 Tax=Aristolochia fimbriata TaxID=158543 RepID=A0AAV7EEM7_ARIFI|nr:hypothetical protein H6P81_012999 [Aristolochia fimbriata]